MVYFVYNVYRYLNRYSNSMMKHSLYQAVQILYKYLYGKLIIVSWLWCLYYRGFTLNELYLFFYKTIIYFCF